MNETKTYQSLKEFYAFYLGEHTNRVCRRLHFAGTSMALVLLLLAIIIPNWGLIPLALIQGYAFAWAGHFFFEHNRPATFSYPWFSFVSDWRMWWEILTGRIGF